MKSPTKKKTTKSKMVSTGKDKPYKPDKTGSGKIPDGKKMGNGKFC